MKNKMSKEEREAHEDEMMKLSATSGGMVAGATLFQWLGFFSLNVFPVWFGALLACALLIHAAILFKKQLDRTGVVEQEDED